MFARRARPGGSDFSASHDLRGSEKTRAREGCEGLACFVVVVEAVVVLQVRLFDMAALGQTRRIPVALPAGVAGAQQLFAQRR